MSPDPRQILVIELWNIGDVVLTVPFISTLRRRFPSAEITLLAQRHAIEVLGHSGIIDHFIEADLAWYPGRWRYSPFVYEWKKLWRTIREVRRKKFDIAFSIRGHIRERFILILSGARQKVSVGFGVADRFITHAVAPENDSHTVETWRSLLRPFGGEQSAEAVRVVAGSSEKAAATEFLQSNGIVPTRPIVGVHPGASTAAKRWPLQNFADVVADLAAAHPGQVIVFVDPTGYGASLSKIAGVATAQLSLPSMMALLERCSVLVCNDSGPMHLAGALGVPTVALFSEGIAKSFSPIGEGHQILVRPVTVPEVISAAKLAIQNRPFPTPSMQSSIS